jgi:RNA polymerase sigma-70 factor (ECF subfamily)
MEPSEFTALITRHARLIHKIAFAYCRRASDRDDVVQEIAAQLWRSRERFDPRFRETTWIYRIALNVAISYYRRERRHVAEPVGEVEAEPPPEETRTLLGFIEQLGALDRALVLLYLDGNDHAAIGEVLGISPSNVGTKLSRIKDKLRAAYAREEKSHGAG